MLTRMGTHDKMLSHARAHERGLDEWRAGIVDGAKKAVVCAPRALAGALLRGERPVTTGAVV